MPSDDLVLNVRQIAGYPAAGALGPNDSLLIQQNGIGGPYASISPEALVGTALSSGGDMMISGKLTAFDVQGGTLNFNNGAFNQLLAQSANIINLSLAGGNINGDPLATQGFVGSTTVSSFNFRRGDVVLDSADITAAGGVQAFNAHLEGVPTAPTPDITSNSSQIATTAFVQMNIGGQINYLLQTQPFVFSWNGRSGDVVLTMDDLVGADGALLDSPNFVGNPTAPTPPPGDSSTSLATTEFVTNAIGTNNAQQNAAMALIYAPINNPILTGVPTAPTAAPGTQSGQLATTAFVMNAVASSVAGVSTFNGRGGNVTLISGDITGAGGALLASPNLSGVPTAPTAAANTNTTQLATCAYVQNAVATSTAGVTSFNSRTGAVVLTVADLTGIGGALLASPVFTGNPQAPTAAPGNNTTSIATTAFVQAAISAGTAGVASFNGRTGVVTLTAADVSAAGGLSNPSPSLTGTPTAPTAPTATNSTQIATTAFVVAAIAQDAVTTFNGRSGAVTLTTTDITGAGGAPLASPAFTGTPTGTTAAPGTSTTQLATTAFVAAAITGGSLVSSFNGRTGAITLTTADVTGAGGAVLASPAFTGSPTAPTATVGTNSTVIATTQFVTSAIAAIPAAPVASTTNPLMDGTVAIGTGTTFARADHVHPSDTSRLSTAAGGTVSGPVDLKVQTVTQSGATLSINRALGENCTMSLTAAITSVAVTNWPASGFTGKVRLIIVSTGSFAISGWPAGTKWPGGTAPTITASGRDIILLMSDDGGTTIYGSVVGQGYA